MSQVWFTSDLHLGDEWPARMRFGASNAAHHDQWLADTWDAVVGEDDDVWVLGDITVIPSPGLVKDWLDKRPGRAHLVMGNLDEWLSQREWASEAGFATAYPPGLPLYHEKVTVGLTHRPQAVVGHWAAATLHGHTHKKTQKAHRDDKGRLLIHVGWDAWRKPVPWTTITDIISEEKRSGTV